MKKVHMMSFCLTRMAYLLKAAAHSVKFLVPLCNVLVTLDVKKEQRDVFLTPKSMFVLHALADLEKPFQKQFLKALYTDQSIVIDVYRINSALEFRYYYRIHFITIIYVFVNSMHYSFLFGLSIFLTMFLLLQFFVT